MVDFGFARLKPKRDMGNEGEGNGGMRTPCFTLQYAAPEVLEQALPADAKVSFICFMELHLVGDNLLLTLK